MLGVGVFDDVTLGEDLGVGFGSGSTTVLSVRFGRSNNSNPTSSHKTKSATLCHVSKRVVWLFLRLRLEELEVEDFGELIFGDGKVGSELVTPKL